MTTADDYKFPLRPQISHLEPLAEQLEKSDWFRVLRKMDFREMATPVEGIPEDAGSFIILDVEATGKDREDKPCELGMVEVAYDRFTGLPYGVRNCFSALEDPGIPIKEDATFVNGITDEMVKGHRFDDAAVEQFVSGADFAVCHNSGFDRGMVESRFSFFERLPFACSFKDVDWRAARILSARQENLAAEAGFYYEAHRALADCLALGAILQFAYPGLPSGTPLASILEAIKSEGRKIWAVGAPFDRKELLQQRGYRWHVGDAPGEEKAWALEVPAADFAAEMAWLKENVFRRDVYLPVDRVDSTVRYSRRRNPMHRDASGSYI